jgi:hypothetical protein
LNKVINVFDGFKLEQRSPITDAWSDWIADQRVWSSFISLTFKDEISQDAALGSWGRLVRVLNRHVVGNHYTRVVDHSYFSYCLGLERQQRNVLHIHGIVDRPIDFEMIHRYWNAAAGWVWIDRINDRSGAVEYLTKYVMKGGEIVPYLADHQPYQLKPGRERPTWWIT